MNFKLASKRNNLRELISFRIWVDHTLHKKYSNHMAIFSYRLKAYLPNCHSLKEKRGVIKSLISKIQHKFRISAAEIGFQDVWQTTEIGMVWIISENKVGQKMLENIKEYLYNDFPYLYIESEYVEIL